MIIEKAFKTTHNYSVGYASTTEIIEIVPKAEVDRISEAVNSLKESKIENIKFGDKIYFHKSAEFPRHKFKDIMNNPITRKIEAADYVVIGKSTLIYSLGRLWPRRFWRDNGNWYDGPVNKSTTTGEFLGPDWRGSRDHITTLQNAEGLIGKKVIFDNTLNKLVPREVNISENLFERLTKMLSCQDKQSVKVGVEILNNLNYDEYRTEVLMLLNQNYDNIRKHGACYGVLFKSLIDVVSKDCPHWNSGNRLGFSLGLLEGDSSNETLRKGVEEYLSSIHNLKSGRYRIDIVKDVEIQ